MADGRLAAPFRRQLSVAPCYVCRFCTNIVGWHQHLVSYAIPNCFPLTQVPTGNVVIDLILYERGMHRLSSLHCGTCLRLLGWKIDQYTGPFPTIFGEGRFVLFANRVYFWNGRNLHDPVWRPGNRINR